MGDNPQSDSEFVRNGIQLLEFVVNYHDTIRELPVKPSVDIKPGYLKQLLPDGANDQPHTFQDVFQDFQKLIMPGMVHWQSPKFHGFYPTGFSYASIYADILSAALASQGFTWAACPIYTELEVLMMDWMAKEIDLPKKFRFDSGLGGGGVIQSSASEAVTVAILAAREKTILGLLENDTNNETTYHQLLSKLRAYASDQAHSSFLKAARICAVNVRILESEADLRLCGETLLDAIQQDKEQGLIPFFVCTTLGTTNTCAFDNLQEIGPICHDNQVWLHVDAAYAGSTFVCPEYRTTLMGINFAQSFNFNPHKLMEICFDCSLLWIETASLMKLALGIYPTYLKSLHQDLTTEYKDWQLSLGRRFRSLKLWFHIRLMGMNYVREQMRKHLKLAQYFGALVQEDSRFEITFPIAIGLVCIIVKADSDKMTRLLYQKLNDEDIFLSASEVKGKYFIRFCVGCSKCEVNDVISSWNIIQKCLDRLSPIANGH